MFIDLIEKEEHSSRASLAWKWPDLYNKMQKEGCFDQLYPDFPISFTLLKRKLTSIITQIKGEK